MKPALDASRALTLALTATQTDTIAKLDALATRCSKQIGRISEVYAATISSIQAVRDEALEELHAIREMALSLRAEVQDGNDDMARAMANVFGQKAEPLGEADEETKALALRLAPVERAA